MSLSSFLDEPDLAAIAIYGPKRDGVEQARAKLLLTCHTQWQWGQLDAHEWYTSVIKSLSIHLKKQNNAGFLKGIVFFAYVMQSFFFSIRP